MDQLAQAILTAKAAGDTFYYTVGDTVYYPGVPTNLQYYSNGSSAFVEYTTSTTYDQVNDGALLLTFKPGFDFVPPKADLTPTSFSTLGHLQASSMTFEALVQEVTVKRKKKKILN